MDGLIWILVTPLALSWAWALWLMIREREVRAALPVLLLPALAARHLTYPLPAPSDPLQLLSDELVATLGLDLAINLLAAAATIVMCQSLHERNRAEQSHWSAMATLHRVAGFFATGDGPFERRLQQLLDLGRGELGMEVGALLRCGDEQCRFVAVSAYDEFGYAEGDAIDREATLTDSTLQASGPLCLENIGQSHWARHAAREVTGHESYIGIGVAVRGEAFGTLAFSSPTPRAGRFTRIEKAMVELMAHWIESALETRQGARDRVELTRLQSAALDLSRLSLEQREPGGSLQTSLEYLVKVLDIAGASLVRLGPEPDSVETVARAGADPTTPATAADIRDAAQRSAEPLEIGAPVEALAEAVEPAAALCVPIVVGGQVTGALSLDAHAPRAFSAEEADFIQMAANLLADALVPPPSAAVTQTPAAGGRTLVPRRGAEPRRNLLELEWAIPRLVEELRERPGHSVDVEVDRLDPGLQVALYRYELDRILESLIEHAAAAAELPGLRLEAFAVNPPGPDAHRPAFAAICVHTRGPALSSEAIDALFEPSAPDPSKRHLPLRRIERLLRDAGGDLSIHSDAERGTGFTAYLELAK